MSYQTLAFRMGVRIAIARVSIERTRAEFAQAIGCPLDTLLSVERGRRLATTDFTSRICAALGISHDELFPPDKSPEHAPYRPVTKSEIKIARTRVSRSKSADRWRGIREALRASDVHNPRPFMTNPKAKPR